MIRRRHLLGIAGVGAAALAGCASSPSVTQSPSSSQSTSPASTTSTASTTPSTSTATPGSTESTSPSDCLPGDESMSLEAKVGQLLMGSVDQPSLSAQTLALFRSWKLGSVVVLGNNITSAAAMKGLATQLKPAAGEIPILIAADQEGGQIQRLKGSGFSDIPSAVVQSRSPIPTLTQNWTTWAVELANAGVLLNLAPVADVVPPAKVSSNAPVGQLQRYYGTNAAAAIPPVQAAIAGMGAAGVGTSIKHFPGLGEVVANTDFGVATDTVTTATSPNLEVFTSAMAAGADSVMISSAIYTKIDPDNQAVFSAKVITGLLRQQLNWNGLVISDDLGAAAAVKNVSPAERATRFVAAGGDLVICADLTALPQMLEGLLAKAKADPEFEKLVTASASRVLALKRKLAVLAAYCR